LEPRGTTMPGFMFMVDVINAAASKNAGEMKIFE
jgi:hypothetical protein